MNSMLSRKNSNAQKLRKRYFIKNIYWFCSKVPEFSGQPERMGFPIFLFARHTAQPFLRDLNCSTFASCAFSPSSAHSFEQ
jgi:hypothetical protein